MCNRKVLVLILNVVGLVQFAFAQQQDLKLRLDAIDNIFNSRKNIHLKYTMMMKGKGEYTHEDKLQVNYYKSEGAQHIVMGGAQEIMTKNNTVLVANHVQKTIMVQEDSSNAIVSDQILFSQLFSMIDSATSVKEQTVEGKRVFSLSFAPQFLYKQIQFVFNEKDKQLKKMVAEFSPSNPEPFSKLTIIYEKWDASWKPESNFPEFGKYVKKTGNKFHLLPQWSQYQFYQPEYGVLKY